MKIIEKFGVPEPQWILDKTESGPLFWRRGDKEDNSEEKGNKCRVKFRCDVEVKEFSRSAHELEEIEWPEDMNAPGNFVMGITCLFCIAISVLLPWYIIGGGSGGGAGSGGSGIPTSSPGLQTAASILESLPSAICLV